MLALPPSHSLRNTSRNCSGCSSLGKSKSHLVSKAWTLCYHFVFFLDIFQRLWLCLQAGIRSVHTDVNRILLLASWFTDNQDGGFLIVSDLCKEKPTPVRSPHSAKHSISCCLAPQHLNDGLTAILP